MIRMFPCVAMISGANQQIPCHGRCAGTAESKCSSGYEWRHLDRGDVVMLRVADWRAGPNMKGRPPTERHRLSRTPAHTPAFAAVSKTAARASVLVLDAQLVHAVLQYAPRRPEEVGRARLV